MRLNDIQSPQRKLRTKNYYKITCDPTAISKKPLSTSSSARGDITEQDASPEKDTGIKSNKKLKKKETIQRNQLITSHESDKLVNSRVSEQLLSHVRDSE